jgi:serine/threonine-protein kinase RsbW
MMYQSQMRDSLSEASYQITIASETSRLEQARAFVAEHVLQAGYPDAVAEAFTLSVDEACTNVIKHAYGGAADGLIGITVRVLDDRLEVRIQDTGRAFERSTYQEPDLAALTRRRRGGGLGVHIMHRLMDEVEYRRTGSVNEVTLVKRRESAVAEGDAT